MLMRYLYALLLLALSLGRTAYAQQPFLKYGVTVKVATLSNGRFQEFFTNDSLRRIGSVVYDTRLHRVAYLLPPDSLVGHAKPDITSRWMSPDPLAEKDNFISPYAFARDNAIRYNDPDGREVVDGQDGPTPGKPIPHRPPLRPNNTTASDATRVRPAANARLGRAFSAERANAEYAKLGMDKPPVKPGTRVTEFQSQEGEGFVRVYDGSPGSKSGPVGSWVMRRGDVKGLSPGEIQHKYSLPSEPTHQVEVNPPTGTTIQRSTAGEAFKGFEGGGTQYRIMERIPLESFGTPTEIPTVEMPTVVMPMPTIMETPIVEPPIIIP